jgi:hypothetical protein
MEQDDIKADGCSTEYLILRRLLAEHTTRYYVLLRYYKDYSITDYSRDNTLVQVLVQRDHLPTTVHYFSIEKVIFL